MAYTIKQAAEKTNLTIYTLRYYDKEGLLPLLKRTSSGIRKFSDNDINWLNLICCLKNSGMSIENLKKFMFSCLKGNENCEERKKILQLHKDTIVSQIKHLESSLDTINYKIDHYTEIGVFHINE